MPILRLLRADPGEALHEVCHLILEAPLAGVLRYFALKLVSTREVVALTLYGHNISFRNAFHF